MGGRKRSDGKAAAAATDVLLPGPGAPTACTPPSSSSTVRKGKEGTRKQRAVRGSLIGTSRTARSSDVFFFLPSLALPSQPLRASLHACADVTVPPDPWQNLSETRMHCPGSTSPAQLRCCQCLFTEEHQLCRHQAPPRHMQPPPPSLPLLCAIAF